MKFPASALLTIAALSLGSVSSHAVTIASGTSIDDPNGTVQVGSATDFAYFNTSLGHTVSTLTNFNVFVDPANHNGYTGNDKATAPDGTTFMSGDWYQGGAAPTASGQLEPGIVYFTLNPTSTLTDFSVFVLVNNVTNDNGFQTSEVTLTADNGTTLLATDPQTFTPATPDHGATAIPTYVEFNITGAAPGENFALTTNSDGTTGGEVIGAVSFQAAPEPSTYAMMLGGLALLGFLARRKLVTLRF